MKLAICAGPATTGKTSVLRHIIRKLQGAGEGVAFLKIDVQFAEEDEELAREFGIPTRKVYSGELCPDHCSVMVLGEALQWAQLEGAGYLLVETAGLCLRCSPYVDGGLGLVVLEATSGMNLPRKIGPMLSLADVAVVTKIDRISQAEREVFRAASPTPLPASRAARSCSARICIDPLVERIRATPDVNGELCCAGNRRGTCLCWQEDSRWQSHSALSPWSTRRSTAGVDALEVQLPSQDLLR